jgi:hypothetical protein
MATTATSGTPSAIMLLVSDSYGIYIPQTFLAMAHPDWAGIKAGDAMIIGKGPEHEHYWEAWTEILGNATFTTIMGHTYRLHQDGDLWMYCEALMTDEEYQNFFGVPRERVDEWREPAEYDPTPDRDAAERVLDHLRARMYITENTRLDLMEAIRIECK